MRAPIAGSPGCWTGPVSEWVDLETLPLKGWGARPNLTKAAVPWPKAIVCAQVDAARAEGEAAKPGMAKPVVRAVLSPHCAIQAARVQEGKRGCRGHTPDVHRGSAKPFQLDSFQQAPLRCVSDPDYRTPGNRCLCTVWQHSCLHDALSAPRPASHSDAPCASVSTNTVYVKCPIALHGSSRWGPVGSEAKLWKHVFEPERWACNECRTQSIQWWHLPMRLNVRSLSKCPRHLREQAEL